MKWINHKLLTGSIVYAITGNSVMAIFSAVGSIIPDAVEGFPTQSNYYQWRQSHRQKSHWFVPYLLTFFLFQSYNFLHPLPASFYQLWSMAQRSFLNNLPIYSWLIAALALGACLHIVEDAFCGKIPGLILKERIGIKLFYVGSLKEYVYVLPISALLLLVRLKMEHIL